MINLNKDTSSNAGQPKWVWSYKIKIADMTGMWDVLTDVTLRMLVKKIKYYYPYEKIDRTKFRKLKRINENY